MRKIKVVLKVEIDNDYSEDDIIDDDVMPELIDGAEYVTGIESLKLIEWDDMK